MKIAVVGSRSITDKDKIYKHLDFIMENEEVTEIISGGAKGVDSIAKQYALEHKLNYSEFLPDWNTYGKSAGYRRNKLIVEASDMVIAIWDGQSKGTLHSINLAKELNKDYVIFHPNGYEYAKCDECDGSGYYLLDGKLVSCICNESNIN